MKDMNFKIGDDLVQAYEEGYQKGRAKSKLANFYFFNQGKALILITNLGYVSCCFILYINTN